MTPDAVLVYLRKRGVSVHHVSPEVDGGVTIYMERNLGQMEFAEYLMRQLPAVKKTREVSPGIMRVTPKP